MKAVVESDKLLRGIMNTESVKGVNSIRSTINIENCFN